MKTLKILLIAAVILAIMGIFLPQQYNVTRSLEMTAPATVIQGHVQDMDTWDRWTVWDEVEPPPAGARPAEMQSGVGSGKYLSGKSGSGWFVITNNSDIDGFEYMVLSDSGDQANAEVIFLDQGGNIKVVWTVRGVVSKPPVVAPYLAIIKSYVLGASINQNLKNLKKLVEQEDVK